MLFKRQPRIEHRSANPTKGQEHLRPGWVALLRWLQAHRVEFVLVGPVAEAIRGNVRAEGPVSIVPAPYRRNLERLARALCAEHARLRVDAGTATGADPSAAKLEYEQLTQDTRWTLRCGAHDIDIEGGLRNNGAPAGMPSYQELLYEAGRFALEPDLSVEVASTEDIERFSHLRRTGSPPEIKIIHRRRQAAAAPAQAQPAEQQPG